MSSDGHMRYNFAGLADYTSAMVSYSQELDQIKQEAMHELSGIQAFFNTEHGSVAYTQAQNLINDGIEDGKMVIAAHGDAVDTSSQEFLAQDIAAGNSF